MRGRLTERQNQVYEFLRSYLRENGRPPYIREIGEHLAIKSTNGVHKLLVAIEKKGYIRRTPNEVRGIEILDDDVDPFDVAEDTPRIRLARRTAAVDARRPFPRSPRSFVLDPELVGRDLDFDACLLVPAGDDGMNGEGVRKNDVLVVEEVEWRDLFDGELVAVLFDRPERIVARRFSHKNGRLHFLPADRTYTEEVVPPDDDETFVIGRIRAIVRRFGR